MSTLVSKVFRSAYGYSPETLPTFTASATVYIGDQTKEAVGIYTGMVNLPINSSKNFSFAVQGGIDALNANTTYTVTVAENEAYQPYVFCNTSEHTFTFTTDENAQLAAGSTGTSITNYYTYYYIPYYPPYVPPTIEIEDDDALGLNTTDHFAYIIGYSDGTVQPGGQITRAEVATIFFRLLTDDVRQENFTRTNPYSDVAGTAWYNNAVSTLSAMGIITGYPDGTFGPQRSITRAETMTLVNRVLDRKPETEDDLLPDMVTWTDNADKKAWYYLAVQEATNSHYYEFKTNSQYEKWTELRETRDWSQLEK